MKVISTLAVIALLGILGISDARAVYDPYVGRWLSRDPMGEQMSQPMLTLRMPGAMRWQQPSLNLYSYVGNDPANYVDPMGLWGIFFFVSGTLAAPTEGVIPEAENVEVAGWDSQRGWYTESINAAGGALGSHNNNVSGFRGTYVDSNGCKGTISLREANAGPEAGVAGAGGGAGYFNDSSGDSAVYGHANGTSLGGNVSLGGGVSF